MSEFGNELVRLMTARGVGVRELARQVPCNPGHISNLKNGRARPSPELALALDRALAADGQLVAAWEASRQIIPASPLASIAPDADLYGRITRAVDDPLRIDAPVLEWLEHTLAEHRRVEDSVGARPLLGLIRSQLATVADFTHSAQGPLADRLVGLAAEYAQFMAWLCIDVHDHAAGLAWYDRAHDWAQEAGDANMAATTLSMKAHMAWSAAADLLTAGLETLPESYRRDRAWYGACLVSAHTGAGDAEQAEAVALQFAADIAEVNSYARGELLDAARKLHSVGAPQAEVIRSALGDEKP